MRVVVVGGGFAAAELLLALRAMAGGRVHLTLVTPRPELAFRPAAPGGAFGAAEVTEYDLRELAEDVGARYVHGVAEAVASGAHRVRLASGGVVEYDALVLALGARPRVGIPGATTYRDHRDADAVARLLGGLREGSLERVAFAIPGGAKWTLPLYELALLTAGAIEDEGLIGSVTLATPEQAPLEVFGPEVSAAVREQLTRRAVHFEHGVHPVRVIREGLALSFDGLLRADQVLAVPQLVGRWLTGVPAAWSGFVGTDERGGVLGVPDVYAAGDMTSFPIKQGGLAAQQADLIASDLARRAGADVPRRPVRHVLRAQLLGADEPLYLYTELDGNGHPLPVAPQTAVAGSSAWWPSAKLFAPYLTPWMAQRTAPVASVA
jgi:sulfide:quinone oxidoreductase